MITMFGRADCADAQSAINHVSPKLAPTSRHFDIAPPSNRFPDVALGIDYLVCR